MTFKVIELNNDFYSRAVKLLGEQPEESKAVNIHGLVSDAILNWLSLAINSGQAYEVELCIETCQLLSDCLTNRVVATSKEEVIQEFWNRL